MATLPIVDTQDKRIGLISAVVAMLLVFLIMWLVKYEIVDPPPPDLHLEAAAPLDKTIIEDLSIENAGGGGGDPSSDPKNNLQTTEQIITNNESTTPVNSGNANTTTTQNSDNPPSGDNVDNPFSGGFGGGTGGGNGTGNGTGIGSDDGPGKGPGTSGAGKRTVLAHVNANDIRYNHDVTFVFQVGINEDGYIVDIRNKRSETTTSDGVIINKVKELVRKQVRYSKAPGAPLQTLIYTVNFKAS